MIGRYLLYILCWVCLWGCGTSKPYIDNVYEAQVKDFTSAGVRAMHERRWSSAEHAFKRALQLSELLSDPAFEVRSLYNMAMALKAEGRRTHAEDALLRAQAIANRHGLRVASARVALQLALLHPQATEVMPPSPFQGWSAEMYLSLGTWWRIHQHQDEAAKAYRQVLQRAAEDKYGMMLRGRAMLGLAHVSDEAPGNTAWAKQALQIFRRVGAPVMTARALRFLAMDREHETRANRLDDAERARTIYHLLQDKVAEQHMDTLIEQLQAEDE